jgi:hypothetical protein
MIIPVHSVFSIWRKAGRYPSVTAPTVHYGTVNANTAMAMHVDFCSVFQQMAIIQCMIAH